MALSYEKQIFPVLCVFRITEDTGQNKDGLSEG